ncbi:hypothetical protein [Streptomyces sp. NPDC056682]|uniref:hypothetical protein n=1 Tax=Streptomyces sp. NPDC056682 TaxID=3345909 RepID=UPI0036B18E09
MASPSSATGTAFSEMLRSIVSTGLLMIGNRADGQVLVGLYAPRWSGDDTLIRH